MSAVLSQLNTQDEMLKQSLVPIGGEHSHKICLVVGSVRQMTKKGGGFSELFGR